MTEVFVLIGGGTDCFGVFSSPEKASEYMKKKCNLDLGEWVPVQDGYFSKDNPRFELNRFVIDPE